MTSRMKSAFNNTVHDFDIKSWDLCVESLESLSYALESGFDRLDKFSRIKETVVTLSMESATNITNGVAFENIGKTVVDTIIAAIRRIKEYVKTVVAYLRKILKLDDTRSTYVEKVILPNIKDNLEDIGSVVPGYKPGSEQKLINSSQVTITPEKKDEAIEYFSDLQFPQDAYNLFRGKSNSLDGLSSNLKNYYKFIDSEIAHVGDVLLGNEIVEIHDCISRISNQFRTKVNDTTGEGVKEFVSNNLQVITQSMAKIVDKVPAQIVVLDNYTIVFDKESRSFSEKRSTDTTVPSNNSVTLTVAQFDEFITKVKKRNTSRERDYDETESWIEKFEKLNAEVATILTNQASINNSYVVDVCRNLVRSIGNVIRLLTQFSDYFFRAEHRVNNTMWQLIQYENKRIDKFCKTVFAGRVKSTKESIKNSKHIRTV